MMNFENNLESGKSRSPSPRQVPDRKEPSV